MAPRELDMKRLATSWPRPRPCSCTGARANLVPQEANFNRRNHAQLENKMATCGGLSNGRMLYSITVSYQNNTTLIPNTWNVYIEDRTEGDYMSLNFQTPIKPAQMGRANVIAA